MRDIYLIRSYKGKDGKEYSDWIKIGFAWGENKDGSISFELFTMPGVKLQMREREERQARTQKEEAPF